MRRRWFRRRCKNDDHTFLWSVDDRTGIAVEQCWFCSATRGIERMAPKHPRPDPPETKESPK